MSTQTLKDQIGDTITIPFPPKRIISLVPSQTELLFYLGLDEEVIGITKFCIHPNQHFQSKQKIGGTKQLKLDLIKSLKPDLIIANKEENDKAQIEALDQFPVWTSDIKTLPDALDMIQDIGKMTDKKVFSDKLVVQIKKNFDKLGLNRKADFQPKRVAYFIWRNPYMIAAKNTFIDDVLTRGGFANCFAEKDRYPQIEIADLQSANPDYIFLSSEPYPFNEKHIEELKLACPNTKIRLVDGELFSWYGNRLLKTGDYLEKLLMKLK